MRTIKTEVEFDELMREIDSRLRSREVSLPARELLALSEASKILGVRLIGGPLSTGPVPGIFSGESLSAHIFNWIQNRYGGRLKFDLSNGHTVILLKGDAWLVTFPLIFGTMTLLCDRDLATEYPNFVALIPGKHQNAPILNVLSCIDSLTQAFANDLSDVELRLILDVFVFGHTFLTTLNSFCRNDDLAMTALTDLDASAKYCVGDSAGYGASRWSSLQAGEKFLKHYIAKRNASFAHVHDLKKLSQQALQYGLPKIDDAVVNSMQCQASVRYEIGRHKLIDVVRAHHGALSIGSLVMKTLHPS